MPTLIDRVAVAADDYGLMGLDGPDEDWIQPRCDYLTFFFLPTFACDNKFRMSLVH